MSRCLEDERTWRKLACENDPRQFVFSDFTHRNPMKEHRPRGRGRSGEETQMLIHRTWGHRANCMCFMSLTGNPRSPDRALGGIIHSHISYANADAPHALMIIESFVDQYMNPFPNFNSVLVLDNASYYQNKNIRRAVEAAGARLLYIPPGAKELNPIKEAFSKVKYHVLRNRSDVERDPLGTLLKAFHSITHQDAEGYFRHAGWTISRSDDVELLLALEE